MDSIKYDLGVFIAGKGERIIEGLGGLGPFKTALWGNYEVYTSESLWEKHRGAIYICPSYSDEGITICDRTVKSGSSKICLGRFINLMSPKEKALAENCIDEIMKVLGVE